MASIGQVEGLKGATAYGLVQKSPGRRGLEAPPGAGPGTWAPEASRVIALDALWTCVGVRRKGKLREVWIWTAVIEEPAAERPGAKAPAALAVPDVGKRLERFTRLFQERHLPLCGLFLDFWLDAGKKPPFTRLCRGIPFGLMGFGYDGPHGRWEGYREGLSARSLLPSPGSHYDEPDGLRTDWLEAAARCIPQETLRHMPAGGIPLDTLTEALKEIAYRGAAQAAAWVRA